MGQRAPKRGNGAMPMYAPVGVKTNAAKMPVPDRMRAWVLGDPELRQRLSANGRATVERAYDWNVIGDAMHAAIAHAYQEPVTQTN